jgi:ABC-type branched-subunit amino acid transport system substrate-binding protein
MRDLVRRGVHPGLSPSRGRFRPSLSIRCRRLVVLSGLITLSLTASACGSRLDAAQQAEAKGASSNGAGDGSAGSGAVGNTGVTATTIAGTAGGATAAGATTGGATGGTTGGTAGSSTAGVTHAGTAGTAGTAKTGTAAPAAAGAGACGANGNQTPAAGNGGATATGVTATTITVGNIASISGVAPGLTQSAQQATEAWAAYVNSTGGICGRQIKVTPYDDGNDSGTNYSDAQQACSADFAMVGNASGFDDGSAQAVSACSIPTMAAEVSTAAAGATADIFGATSGSDHYWLLGPANYLKATYPNAITHAAMIYLNVSATQTAATHEVAAYTSVGFKYVYDQSTTPTNSNYAANVQAMQSAGAQYVTEYSDASSAERLLQSMQQANYAPQVVDWFSEEYSPQFVQQTSPESNGDLVLMSATAAYEEASSNPGMQLMESWLNRVAPGYHQDIFAILAWSAGLAFEQAAKAVGPDLTRPALISQIQQITNWTGGGVTPPVNIGQKIPSKCFFYMKIENGAFQRVYPTAPGSYDCNSGLFQY